MQKLSVKALKSQRCRYIYAFKLLDNSKNLFEILAASARPQALKQPLLAFAIKNKLAGTPLRTNSAFWAELEDHAREHTSAAKIREILRAKACELGINGALDEIFEFSDAYEYQHENCKILLCVLEYFERHHIGSKVELAECELEHIEARGAAEHSSERLKEQWLSALANLTLLERELNRRASAKNFERKREFYAQSKYSITRRLASCWPGRKMLRCKQLKEREEWMRRRLGKLLEI